MDFPRNEPHLLSFLYKEAYLNKRYTTNLPCGVEAMVFVHQCGFYVVPMNKYFHFKSRFLRMGVKRTRQYHLTCQRFYYLLFDASAWPQQNNVWLPLYVENPTETKHTKMTKTEIKMY